jgi:hypothetical protein
MSDFAEWMKVMGYNGKQVSEAAKTIGIDGKNTASMTYNGQRALTLTERLAMTAVRAGLAPWSPETDTDISEVIAIKRAFDRMIDERLSTFASASGNPDGSSSQSKAPRDQALS